MPYVGKKPADIIATAVDTTTGTFSGDIDASTVNATGDTAAGDNAAIGFTSAEGLILTGQGSTSDITVKNDADATVFTVPTGTDDILFPDNAKILMGAGSDLQIFHDGSNSNIDDAGTGPLRISSNGTGIDFNKGTSETMAKFKTDGAVELYHDGTKKFETASTGVNVTGTADSTLSITAGGTSNDSLINFVHGSTTDGGITYDHNGAYASEQMQFRTGNNTPNMTLNGAGTLTVANGLTLTDGNLVVASGHGIDFSAAGNASGMSSELLDDYEEGTFTPTIESTETNPTVSYSIQEGNYTKIGNQVTAQGYITFSSYSGNGGSARLHGLPFNVVTHTNYRAVGQVAISALGTSLTGDYTSLQLSYNSGTSMQIMMNNSVTGGMAETPADNIDAGTFIRYQITYFTS